MVYSILGSVHIKLARWQDGDGECVWQDGKWQVSSKCSWWMVPSLPAMGWWTLAMTDTHKIQNICIRKVFCQSLFSRGGNCGHQSKTLQNFNKSPESLHCFYLTFSPCPLCKFCKTENRNEFFWRRLSLYSLKDLVIPIVVNSTVNLLTQQFTLKNKNKWYIMMKHIIWIYRLSKQ